MKPWPRFKLVAGQRRLEAFKLLGHATIPARVVSNLGAAALLRAERDENTCRKALTMSELESLEAAADRRGELTMGSWHDGDVPGEDVLLDRLDGRVEDVRTLTEKVLFEVKKINGRGGHKGGES